HPPKGGTPQIILSSASGGSPPIIATTAAHNPTKPIIEPGAQASIVKPKPKPQPQAAPKKKPHGGGLFSWVHTAVDGAGSFLSGAAHHAGIMLEGAGQLGGAFIDPVHSPVTLYAAVALNTNVTQHGVVGGLGVTAKGIANGVKNSAVDQFDSMTHFAGVVGGD